LTNLTNDDVDQSDVAWWPDSSRIATFTRPCTVNISCVEQLEVYELSSRSRTAAIDLSLLPILGHSACNPKISSDGQYIAFISNCGTGIGMAMDFPNEIYLANWRTGELTQVTAFAPETFQGIFIATYNHVWFDSDTLLIGASYHIGEQPEQHPLQIYDVDAKVQKIISTDVGTEFAVNPLTRQIAFRNATDGSQIELISPDRLDNSATDFSIDAVATPIASVEPGCELEWSPDGILIAYTTDANGDCQGILESITLINSQTQQVFQHTVSLDDTDSNGDVIPLGWIAG
jgi:WD40-like Beta Propeller Repeat